MAGAANPDSDFIRLTEASQHRASSAGRELARQIGEIASLEDPSKLEQGIPQPKPEAPKRRHTADRNSGETAVTKFIRKEYADAGIVGKIEAEEQGKNNAANQRIAAQTRENQSRKELYDSYQDPYNLPTHINRLITARQIKVEGEAYEITYDSINKRIVFTPVSKSAPALRYDPSLIYETNMGNNRGIDLSAEVKRAMQDAERLPSQDPYQDITVLYDANRISKIRTEIDRDRSIPAAEKAIKTYEVILRSAIADPDITFTQLQKLSSDLETTLSLPPGTTYLENTIIDHILHTAQQNGISYSEVIQKLSSETQIDPATIQNLNDRMINVEIDFENEDDVTILGDIISRINNPNSTAQEIADMVGNFVEYDPENFGQVLDRLDQILNSTKISSDPKAVEKIIEVQDYIIDSIVEELAQVTLKPDFDPAGVQLDISTITHDEHLLKFLDRYSARTYEYLVENTGPGKEFDTSTKINHFLNNLQGADLLDANQSNTIARRARNLLQLQNIDRVDRDTPANEISSVNSIRAAYNSAAREINDNQYLSTEDRARALALLRKEYQLAEVNTRMEYRDGWNEFKRKLRFINSNRERYVKVKRYAIFAVMGLAGASLIGLPLPLLFGLFGGLIPEGLWNKYGFGNLKKEKAAYTKQLAIENERMQRHRKLDNARNSIKAFEIAHRSNTQMLSDKEIRQLNPATQEMLSTTCLGLIRQLGAAGNAARASI